MSRFEPIAGVDPGPFDLCSEGSYAALCLHGLTGMPYEVRPLGEGLAERGIRALGPLLPGHGGTAQECARQSWTDWLEAARGHLRELRQQHERVFVVGLSMGALVSLKLASEEPVDGVVVVGTPLRFPTWMNRLLPVIKHLRPYQKKTEGPGILEPVARDRHPSLDVMPLASDHQVLHLQRRVQASLVGVTAPILIAHGRHDRAANPANSREIYETVGSTQRQLMLCENSGHVVPVDYDGAELTRAASAFLSALV